MDPENLDFFRLRLSHFKAQKSFHFKGPPLPMSLVMGLPASKSSHPVREKETPAKLQRLGLVTSEERLHLIRGNVQTVCHTVHDCCMSFLINCMTLLSISSKLSSFLTVYNISMLLPLYVCLAGIRVQRTDYICVKMPRQTDRQMVSGLMKNGHKDEGLSLFHGTYMKY
jgi:hypothetical protein